MAMPFHSTLTEDEARKLIVLYSKLGYDGEYRIKKDWAEGDIVEAMESAAKIFTSTRK